MEVTLELNYLLKETRHAIASEIDDPKVLAVLAKDRESYVRCAVARNEYTPETALDKLANDMTDQVRWAVAENAKTSLGTLEKLADDLSCNVRRAVACNENADDKLLAKLSMDKDDIVRENVAENSKTGSLTLEEMAEYDPVVDVKLAALGNPNIPMRVIHRMAAGTGKRVRETIAGNISTPQMILMKSARDRDNDVAYNVACNPNAPSEALTIPVSYTHLTLPTIA